MLAKFSREHWHDEDEVRFVVAGRGIFHIHAGGAVFGIEVVPGDLLRVPRGAHHWFDLCAERRIRVDKAPSLFGALLRGPEKVPAAFFEQSTIDALIAP